MVAIIVIAVLCVLVLVCVVLFFKYRPESRTNTPPRVITEAPVRTNIPMGQRTDTEYMPIVRADGRHHEADND